MGIYRFLCGIDSLIGGKESWKGRNDWLEFGWLLLSRFANLGR